MKHEKSITPIAPPAYPIYEGDDRRTDGWTDGLFGLVPKYSSVTVSHHLPYLLE